jgi:uncharacterized phiE125 gp8 family phage protein
MKLVLKTAPAEEPLDVEEVRNHLRITDTAEDSLLDGLLLAARQQAEMHTRRALITQTWQLLLDGWPCGDRIELPKPPLQSVTSIGYVDRDGVARTLDPTVYDLELADAPPILYPFQLPGSVVLAYGRSWPTVTLRSAAPITVEFTSGYGEADAVPTAIKQAMLLLVGLWYENREAAADFKYANGLVPVPFSVAALLDPFRVF